MRLFTVLKEVALIATYFTAVLARQNSNFNVSEDYATAHGCGEKCQEILHATNTADLGNLGQDFDFDFYATAQNFSKERTRAGDVLKFQPLDPEPLDILSGTTVYRFQYASKDLDGSVVPATGFIAFPFTARFPHGGRNHDEDKYRLLAYAHGTTGLFSGCAASNGPGLYDYNTWQTALSGGFAVVATDYAGLGNNYTSHKYMSFKAHVHDVYYSVVTARKLFGHRLTPHWASFGHSQGGGTVWKLAESDYVRNDNTYLGTVALAPATYIIDTLTASIKSDGFLGYLPFLHFALQRAISAYNESFLSSLMRKRLQVAEKAQLCIVALLGLSADLPNDQLLSQPGLDRDMPRLLEWQEDNAPAQGDKSHSPILVVQGLNDTTVLPEITKHAWDVSCEAGNEVHLRLYPGQEHSPVVRAGHAEWLGWLEDLFVKAESGKSKCKPQRCTSQTREPFDGKFVKQPPEDTTLPFRYLLE